MKCENNCGKDLTGRQARFCSDKCRMQFARNPNKPEQNPKVEQKSNKAVTIPKSCSKGLTEPAILGNIDANKVIVHTMSRSELYCAINAYPEDTWKDSLEFKELMHRLKTKSVAELKSEGYYIPSWKHKEVA